MTGWWTARSTPTPSFGWSSRYLVMAELHRATATICIMGGIHMRAHAHTHIHRSPPHTRTCQVGVCKVCAWDELRGGQAGAPVQQVQGLRTHTSKGSGLYTIYTSVIHISHVRDCTHTHKRTQRFAHKLYISHSHQSCVYGSYGVAELVLQSSRFRECTHTSKRSRTRIHFVA